MLKILYTLISLPLLYPAMKHNTWNMLPLALMIITTMTMTLHFNHHESFMYYTESFMTDNLSMPLITLSIWITSMMFMSSQKILITKHNPHIFITLCMTLLISLTLAFSVTNMFQFYILFEASLIPTLIIILMWGYQPERLQAGMYLMLYTVTASLPLLLTILFMYYSSSSNALFMTIDSFISAPMIPLWWIASITAFLAKMPIFMLHLWLPKAHVEAPVAGSMILAAILLKLGSYGILRYSMITSWFNFSMTPFISSLAMWGSVITGLICIRQTDMKSLIAYSSIGHMGLLLAGTMSNSSTGWNASMTMMIAHGLCSSAMFSLANKNYEMSNTRNLYLYKGMLSMFPHLTLMWFLISAMNMAAPPSINLLAEILLILSATSVSKILMPSLAIVSFIAAAYSLVLYTSISHGTPPQHMPAMEHMDARNILNTILHFTPLIFFIISAPLITLWI